MAIDPRHIELTPAQRQQIADLAERRGKTQGMFSMSFSRRPMYLATTVTMTRKAKALTIWANAWVSMLHSKVVRAT
jgi:hypothetical protein